MMQPNDDIVSALRDCRLDMVPGKFAAESHRLWAVAIKRTGLRAKNATQRPHSSSWSRYDVVPKLSSVGKMGLHYD
jgi:hypothetical protein